MKKIWTFKENDNFAEQDTNVDLKTFKASGKFYEDIELLAGQMKIKIHPALKPIVYQSAEQQQQLEEQQPPPGTQNLQEEEKQVKEINTLVFSKHRIDRNSMKLLFYTLPYYTQIHTLKFSNNGFTFLHFNLLIDYLSQDNCPVQHLFIDWNPIYENNYQVSNIFNELYQKKSEDEQSLFAKIVKQNQRLQVLFLRACNLADQDIQEICNVLKPDPAQPNASNKTLKVLDISYNVNLTPQSLVYISEMMEFNRTLEYIGLAKNKLQTEDIIQILDKVGRMPFPQDQVDGHLAKLKQRDQIVEKNKKLKQGKKPEEPVPILDNIEQVTEKMDDGTEVQNWVMLKNVQFKHINLCMNDISDDIKEHVSSLIKRTNDDFGITLSGNPIESVTIEELQSLAKNLHIHRIQSLQSDPNSNAVEDPFIGLKRVGF